MYNIFYEYKYSVFYGQAIEGSFKYKFQISTNLG